MRGNVSQSRFAAIDFESAGATRGATDHPIQIGLAAWSSAGGVRDRFVSYLATRQPVCWSARKVHGISQVQLEHAPELVSLWPVIRDALHGAVVVAHGKGTEKRFLRAFPGHGFGPWLDTLPLARAVWPDFPDHSLSSVCDGLGLTDSIQQLVPGKTWHDAEFDAVASLKILERAVDVLEWHHAPVDHLFHPDTTRWRNSRTT